jgi:hypothetical protein
MSIAKAIVASLAAGLGAAVTATTDNGITLNEGMVIALAAVTGFAAVYFTPNEAT